MNRHPAASSQQSGARIGKSLDIQAQPMPSMSAPDSWLLRRVTDRGCVEDQPQRLRQSMRWSVCSGLQFQACRGWSSTQPRSAFNCFNSAFTLLELLVVISIIALISAIALPVLKSFKPDPLKTASNQLLNDLAYARHRALADHTTVYVVFMPPVDLLDPTVRSPGLTLLTPNEQQKMLNAQFTGYGLYEKRTAGDQPGAATPHWIGNWRSLPPGTMFPREMFRWTGVEAGPQPIATVGFGYWSFNYTNAGQILINPDTNATSYVYSRFPTVAFDYTGALVPPWNDWKPWIPSVPAGYQNQSTSSGFDCVIPLTQGYTTVPTTWTSANYRENPPGCFTNIYTHVIIDGPTGRARRDVRALQ